MNSDLDVKVIFGRAMELTDPVARSAYLTEACGANDSVRAEVESLLKALDQAQEFLTPHGTESVAPESQPRPASIAVGSVIAGKYKLIENIGEGGMGSVYLAQQTEPVKRAVAVKVIKAGMNSQRVLARFDAERQALAMMDHPNIARVLDAGTAENGRPFFVMELVKGVPITEFSDSRKLTVQQRLELFVPVCQAIQHAHQKGVIHRDIKPSNVLVALYDERPVPKVIDFGIAKAIGPQLTDLTLKTECSTVIGSPEYMSPEQASFNQMDVDTRSDVYSLGVLLYELLTGSPPIDRRSLEEDALLEVLRIVREVEAPRPSAKLSTLDALPSIAANRGVEPAKISGLFRGELDWVLLKALEKDRSRRYDSANGLARDIERYLADELVEARPPSAGYRLKKFVRRHRGLVTAASLVIFALILGLAGTAWQAQLAADQRDKALAATAGETRQRITAESQRDKAQILATFLNVMVKGAGPSVARGRDNSILKEMMDKAAALIEAGQLKKNPEVELTLRDTVGNIYVDLALYAEADKMFEPAIALARSTHASDHLDTATALTNLARLQMARGNAAAAEPLARESLTMRRRLFAGDHAELATGIGNLADILRQRGNLAESELLCREALEMDRRLHPGDNSKVAKALDNLAKVLLNRNRDAEAEQLMKEALDMRRRIDNSDRPDLATGFNNLAVVLHTRGDLSGAESLARESLEMRLRLHPNDHPEVLLSQGVLAAIFTAQKKYDKAISLLEAVVFNQEKKLGRQHPDTLLTICNLGANYKEIVRLTEAIALLEEAYRVGGRNPNLRFAGAHLLDAYKMRGDLGDPTERAKVLVTVQEILTATRRSLPKDSIERASLLASGGVVFINAHAYDAAETALRECLAIREKAEPNYWTTFNTMSLLGGALLGQKKFTEAEPLLLKGYEGMKQREATIPPPSRVRLPEGAERLMQLYKAIEKKDEAAKWQREWEAAKKAAETPAAKP